MSGKPVARGASYTAAALWLLVTGYPFVLMMITSLKERREFVTRSIWSLPVVAKLSNYLGVLEAGFLRYFVNSVVVVAISLVLIIVVSSLASFVITRIPFRLSGLVFVTFVAGMTIPMHSTLIPVYTLTRWVHLGNTLMALIGPYVAFMLPISIFILCGFMRTIPREIEESVIIDGAGYFQIYRHVVFPMIMPAIATVAIYDFVHLWNEFVYALVLIASPEAWTLTLGLWRFQGEQGINVPYVMTALSLASLPLLVGFVLMQERVVKGIVAGALKA